MMCGSEQWNNNIDINIIRPFATAFMSWDKVCSMAGLGHQKAACKKGRLLCSQTESLFQHHAAIQGLNRAIGVAAHGVAEGFDLCCRSLNRVFHHQPAHAFRAWWRG